MQFYLSLTGASLNDKSCRLKILIETLHINITKLTLLLGPSEAFVIDNKSVQHTLIIN